MDTIWLRLLDREQRPRAHEFTICLSEQMEGNHPYHPHYVAHGVPSYPMPNWPMYAVQQQPNQQHPQYNGPIMNHHQMLYQQQLMQQQHLYQQMYHQQAHQERYQPAKPKPSPHAVAPSLQARPIERDQKAIRDPSSGASTADGAFTIAINGVQHNLAAIDPTMTLNTFIRSQRGLTGTKISCNEGTMGWMDVFLEVINALCIIILFNFFIFDSVPIPLLMARRLWRLYCGHV
jgi:hypothetical protein